ncbi:MAG: hypothetical protein Q9219_007435 [cf. Caloplaca sp. 3 TL-2023]
MFGFLNQLLQSFLYPAFQHPAPLDRPSLIRSYSNSSNRLLLFDWDGTLTPIVRDPAAAVPTPAVLRTLQRVSTAANNDLWIISGRDPEFLEKIFNAVPSIGLSAEHGAFTRAPGGARWETTSTTADRLWQEDVMKILEQFTAEASGSAIERKNVSITWHYRNAKPEIDAPRLEGFRRRLSERLANLTSDLQILDGKMSLEVRPQSLNKGWIVNQILTEYMIHHGAPLDFVLCAGDDVTDEDMFTTIRHVELTESQKFTVSVGPSSKHTAASWYIEEPADVISLLDRLEPDSKASHDEL